MTNNIAAFNFSLKGIKNTALGMALAIVFLTPNVTLAQNSRSYQIQQLLQLQQNYEIHLGNLQTEIIFYILNNPQASAAILASSGGAVGILQENLDGKTKAVLAGLAMMGINYCVNRENLKNCAVVTTNLVYYANRLNDYQGKLNIINRQIRSLQ